MAKEILPQLDIKFFVSWLACSVSMFSLSYVWHGVILNDFVRINVPLSLFLTISSLVYLVIGLFMTVLTFVLKKIKNSFRYGIAVGAAVGVFIYAIAFMLGVRFYPFFDIKMVLFDLGWQSVEQAFGGLVCGWVYRFMYMESKHAHSD